MIERVRASIPWAPRSGKAALRDAARAAVVMPALLAAAEKETGNPQVAIFAVVLVLVEDTVGSLASLLLAAEIAAVRKAGLHVAHVSTRRMRWGTAAGMQPLRHRSR